MKPKNEFTVLIERDEDGMLIATVPALKGCHTQAKTLPGKIGTATIFSSSAGLLEGLGVSFSTSNPLFFIDEETAPLNKWALSPSLSPTSILLLFITLVIDEEAS